MVRREIDKGSDPAGEKRECREAPTIQNLIERYILEHLPIKTGNDAPQDHRDSRACESEQSLSLRVQNLAKRK
jgi:hypothetical protein